MQRAANYLPVSNPTATHRIPLVLEHNGTFSFNLSRPGTASIMTIKAAEAFETRAINIRDFQDLNSWAERFGVSRERVIRAVHLVGPVSHDVFREICENE